MFTCQMPTAGKKGGFEPLVVGWMTHSLLVDDPPNDPQYGVEHLDKSSVSRGLVDTSLSQCG